MSTQRLEIEQRWTQVKMTMITILLQNSWAGEENIASSQNTSSCCEYLSLLFLSTISTQLAAQPQQQLDDLCTFTEPLQFIVIFLKSSRSNEKSEDCRYIDPWWLICNRSWLRNYALLLDFLNNRQPNYMVLLGKVTLPCFPIKLSHS